MTDFISFRKIPRISRECIITEKIDGTNAQICITEDGDFLVGSRNRWITPEDDNYGFARWAYEHKDELMELGPGNHFGEWWGQKIQRGYDLKEKRFSLFNVSRWEESRPSCCGVVPVIYKGMFTTEVVEKCIELLRISGSQAAVGYDKPEGIVIYHTAANMMFKKTLENDESPKSLTKGV